MAGFDLSKVGELIKNVEAQVLKNGGETNSDGEINTADESSIFNSILEEKQKAGELSNDDVNEILGFVKSNGKTNNAPKRASSIDINDGDTVKIEINVNTNVNIDLTVNADFNAAIKELIENQNQNTDKLIEFFKQYIKDHPDIPSQEFLAEFIKNILNEIMGEVDLTTINDTLNKILEQLGETNAKIDGLQDKIINMAENQLKFFNSMNLKTDEILNGIKKLTTNQEEQIAMLNTLTNVLNKLSADFGEFQGKTVGLLNNIIAKIQTGAMKMDDLMEILKAIESDTSKNAETSNKILGEVAKGNEISQKILEAIKLMNKELEGLGDDVKNGFLSIVTQLVEQGASMDDIKELLNQIKGEASKNNELSLSILNAIKELGTDVSGQLTAILKAINQGNGKTDDLKDLLTKILEKMDVDTKDIINAIGNIKVDGSGNVDLSSIENMLAKLLELTGKNNELLSSIDGKLELINLTGKAILDKMNVEGHKNDERYEKTEAVLNEILDKLKNQTGGYDDSELMKVLKDLSKIFNDRMDEILDAIKDHDVNVTVDVTGKVTCECNCGKGDNNEGIIGDLNKVLMAPKRNTTGISNLNTNSNNKVETVKYVENGQLYIAKKYPDGKEEVYLPNGKRVK